MKKYAFFIDIDGTLVDKKREVNKLNIDAFAAAKSAGNKIFINTGRGKACIPDEILALDFDGVISGCGSNIEYNGDTVLCDQPDNTAIYNYLKTIEARGERCFLEGHNMLFRFNCDEEAIKTDKYFAGYCALARLQFEKWTPLDSADDFLNYPDARIPKLNLVGKYDVSALARFAADFDGVVDEYKCEMFTKAHGKHTAVKYIMDNILSGYTSVVIGDSENDILALECADISVAVKNAAPDIAKKCDFVSERDADEGGVGEMIFKLMGFNPKER